MNSRIIDLTGKKFGRLTVLEQGEPRMSGKQRKITWKCRCDCGNEGEYLGNLLKMGHTTSCGCARKGMGAKDITGQKFGKLTAIKIVGNQNRCNVWRCKCDCGQESDVKLNNLMSGNTTSCGCVGGKCDLIGMKFNKLTVVGEGYVEQMSETSSQRFWECVCDCGKKTYAHTYALKHGCKKSCGCLKYEPDPNYKGYEDLSGAFFSSISRGASNRNLVFEVEIDYLWNLFVKQDKKCKISGVPIRLVRNYGRDRELQTASLDRIDSTKGYTKDNVQWVHKDINKMKWVFSQEDFISMCKQVAEYDNPSPDINPKPNPKTRNYSYPL